eukprot:PhF_6_TR19054/c0_g1_i1/m.28001/K14575/AFG2, DRG1, SPATA5; AAA family ATPase
MNLLEGSIRLHPKTMNELGFVPGMVVQLQFQSDSCSAFAEALLSNDVELRTVAVPLSLSMRGGQNVLIRRYDRMVVSLSLVTVSVSQAMFRRVVLSTLKSTYDSRVISQGMILDSNTEARAQLPEGCAIGRCTSSTVFRLHPSTSIDSGGVNSAMRKMCDTLHAPILERVVETINNILSSKSLSGLGAGIIVHGPSGVGKSVLLRRACEQCQTNVIPFDGLAGGWRSMVMTGLRSAPCVVVVDDVDLLAAEAPLETWGYVQQCLEKWKQNGVVLLVSCCDVGAIDSSLRRPGLFETTLELLPPFTTSQRLEIVQCLVSSSTSCDLKQLASTTHGYTIRDLNNVILQSQVFSSIEARPLTDVHIQKALKHVRPSLLKNVEVSVPNVTWNDIGGQIEAKTCLQECVRWITDESEVLKALNIRPPRGVLLYGPPGCSKTMMAKALANESGMNFLSVKGPELLSKWVGDSEKAVKEVFVKARAVAPCIIFFDELDGLCGTRGSSGGGGVGDRVICQLLNEMDGLPTTSTAKNPNTILVVAATNRPDAIDPALLRPGRFDRKVYVGLPELQERAAIFKIALKGVPVKEDVEVGVLASQTEGYSGAECVAVCREAALVALELSLDTQQLETQHFVTALQRVLPRQKNF